MRGKHAKKVDASAHISSLDAGSFGRGVGASSQANSTLEQGADAHGQGGDAPRQSDVRGWDDANHSNAAGLGAGANRPASRSAVAAHAQNVARGAEPRACEMYPEHIKRRKRKRVAKRVLIAVASVLAAFVIGVGAYALWFSSQLDSRLALDSDDAKDISAALSPVDTNGPFYVLILGSDSREGSGTSSEAMYAEGQERSDVIMLARIDASNRKVTLVSVPRDTPYTYEDGTVGKINETYNKGGAAYTIKAVSELTGVSISHYAEVHISDLEAIVDYLGGVTVNVDTDMTVKDALTGESISLKAGKQTLNGQQAQAFARGRKMYADNQDGHRQSNVRTLLEAVVRKALDRPVAELPDTILNLAQSVSTDMKTSDMVSMALPFASSAGSFKMYGVTGPIDGDNYGDGGIWLCYPNPDGWKKLMAVVDAGEDPSNVDVSDTAVVIAASK